jgi:hypothetical protein
MLNLIFQLDFNLNFPPFFQFQCLQQPPLPSPTSHCHRPTSHCPPTAFADVDDIAVVRINNNNNNSNSNKAPKGNWSSGNWSAAGRKERDLPIVKHYS